MKRGKKQAIENLAEAVAEACKAISAKGQRPTARSVRAWLIREYGQGFSFTHLAPPVRDWKTARRDSKAVQAVCKAFAALDPEEQKAVRERIS